MRLYTAEEISKLLDEFGSYKTTNNQREQMDYMETVQEIARQMDTFLDMYSKKRKKAKSTFIGLFGGEDRS